MPTDPYPIGGTIYDHAASAVTDATTTVIAINVTKSISEGTRVSTSIVTDATDGSYAIDLANETNEAGTVVAYADGDKIQILSYDANRRYYACKRHTVDISAGAPAIDIYLQPGPPHLQTERFLGGFASNSHSSATYFHIYDIERDALVCRVDCVANSTSAMPTSVIGVRIKGGMCIVYPGTEQYIHFIRSVK